MLHLANFCLANFYLKLKIIVDCNAEKAAVGISDRISVYDNPLGKFVKWYKKTRQERKVYYTVYSILSVTSDMRSERKVYQSPIDRHGA